MQAALTVEEESRKAARRHLAKWAKIMLQIVGLERVAEELMGRRSWASYQDAMVGQECRTSEPICAPSQTVGDSGERSGSSSPRAMAASSPATWYIKPSASPEVLDQPLDLSAKPTPPPTVVQPIKIPSPNKHIFKAKPRLSTVAGRRTYTEEELQAALRDIQSGKLGTRRAAVIYGIPRSTLRNKVYKLSQERRDTGGLESAKDDDDDDDDRDLSEEEREVEKALMRPLLTMDDVRLPDGRAWPYLQQLLGGTQVLPELVRNIMAEDRLMRASATRPSCSTDKPDDSVILRVPSFRPKDSGSPLSGRPSDSESPPAKTHALSLRDVISTTITNKLTAGQDVGIVPIPTASTMPLDFRRDAVRNHNNNHMEDKKPGIGKPCVPSSLHNSQMSSSNSSAAGGKGTRPKRGKYRNYDRDSLVEAVRAVQRGEMSVHRAGSYYGVPHSTLEYKVKERHLMRPRKREPKPPQVQTSDSESKGRKEDRSRLQRFTPPLAQPANGLKVPPGFDPAALAAAAAYPPALPFPFWPSAPFAALPGLDYASRELFAQQMMQRLHEDSAAVAGSGSATSATAAVPTTNATTAASTTVSATATTSPIPAPSSGSGGGSGGGGGASPSTLGKTTREIAESLLYDSSSDNGNFLDGIIRSSLETTLGGRGKEAGKALIEHLCRGGALVSDSDKNAEPPTKEPPKSSPSPDRPSSACDTPQC